MYAGIKLNMGFEVQETCYKSDIYKKNEDKIKETMQLYRFWEKVKRLISEDDQSNATGKYVVSIVEEMIVEEILNNTLLLCMECQTDMLELSCQLLVLEISGEVSKCVIGEKKADELCDIHKKASDICLILFNLNVKYSKILKFPSFHDLLEKVRHKHYTTLNLIFEESMSVLDMAQSVLEIIEPGYLMDKTIGDVLFQKAFCELKPIVNNMQRKKRNSEWNDYAVNILTFLWVNLIDVSAEQVSCILSFIDSPLSSLNTIKTEIEKCEEMRMAKTVFSVEQLEVLHP